MNRYEGLLESYEPLIKKLIKRYAYAGTYDELFQIGRIALWEACERYTLGKGSFPAYVQSYIKGRLLHEVRTYMRKRVEVSDHTTNMQTMYVVHLLG